MPQIVFVVVVLIVIVAASRKVRKLLWHVKLWHFLRMFLVTTLVIVFLALAGIAIWYWWTVLRLRAPATSWHDETLQQDQHPDTPGAGGPKKPTIVQ